MNQEIPISFHVLIAAAGKGSRFGSDIPKQYLPLCGKPVITRTIQKFLNCPGLKSLRVIIDPSDAKLYHECTNELSLPQYIEGGKERKDSIFNGLKELSNVDHKDIIVIHDAARPLVTQAQILELVKAAKEYNAATLATPLSDTIKETNGAYPDRSNYSALQTPQAFTYETIMKAHENALPDTTHTDDTMLVAQMGLDVHHVSGTKTNFKITTREDFIMAERLIQSEYNDIRTGSGFDVHAFDTTKNGPVILGGIKISHTNALKGHSDADVALHTITDAILGAIGEGDIGQHFPPSDDTFKNMDSAVFLEKAITLLNKHNAILKNIDLTIICEDPKIGPHTAEMKKRIAEITRLEESRINIKATTTEKLGFTGRGEGIAAQAIATIGMKHA